MVHQSLDGSRICVEQECNFPLWSQRDALGRVVFGTGGVEGQSLEASRSFISDSVHARNEGIMGAAFFSYLDNFNALRANLNSKDLAKEAVSITDLFAYARVQSATLPEDVVFGTYGILRRLDVAIPKPCFIDPVEEIYAKATRAAINHDRSLDVLLETSHNKSYPNLASWAPDWNASPTHGLCRIWSRKLMDSFHASKNQQPKYSFSHEGKHLRVRGAIIDKIVSRSVKKLPARSDASDPQKMQLAVREALRDWIAYASTLKNYPTQEPLKSNTVRTVMMACQT